MMQCLSAARCLIRAVAEGMRLLDAIDAKETPVTNFFKATGLFALWMYSEAIPVLRRAIESERLADLQEEGATPANLAAIVELEKVAREKKLWESIRDLEFQRALHTKDEKTLLRLYFGTPVEAYRI